MKKITLLIVVLFSSVGFSQVNRQKIQSYLNENKAKFGLTSQDIADWSIQSEQNSNSTKISNYRIVQNYNGTEVFNTQSNVWVKDNQVINYVNHFMNNVSSKIISSSPKSFSQTLQSVYNQLGYNFTIFTITENLSEKTYLISDGVQQEPIVAKLGYNLINNSLKLAWSFQFYSQNSNDYWDIKVDASNGAILEKRNLTIACNFGHNDHNNLRNEVKNQFSFENSISKTKATMLSIPNSSYRVIPYNFESPNHHPFEVISNPVTTVVAPNGHLASPNGWHDANTNIDGTTASLQFTYTRGNNIWAQEDADGNNGTGVSANGGASLNFDFPQYSVGVGQTLQPTAYTEAATTNLFYMTNIMHDVWYQYGFDEVNANFQNKNYGRGGNATAAGDVVLADSQDGYSQTTPTLNNANFTPTNDGTRPRIQMFMWTLGAPPTNFINVNSPAPIAGPRSATTNVFEGTDRIPVPVAPNGLTSDLVLVQNGPAPGYNSSCQPPTNAFDISGKIALIKRGGCFFSNKVKNAQDAGAIAAIVMDSIPDNPTRLSMSSTGILGITIPAVFITKEIGDELIAEMANGPVNVTLETPADLYLYGDGSFDNVIIAHEYGHGISNRLVGGGSAGCMSNYDQMGEGWSDWFGLMMQLKAGDTGADPKEIGTYVTNQPVDGVGFRDFAYSTDMMIDPRTYESTNIPIPSDPADTGYRYKQGEFWTSVLWDLTWAYIDKYGYDSNIYAGTGGNNKIMQLVLDALKLDTCNGTNAVTGRDNLFAADQATTGGADYCMIAEVFARRGVGLNASAGSVNDCNDQVEDFTAFPDGPNCTLAVNHFTDNNLFRVFPNPSNGMVNVKIQQYVGNLEIEVYDVNGRLVYSKAEINFNNESQINVQNLQSGVYVVKLKGDSINYSTKLIKN